MKTQLIKLQDKFILVSDEEIQIDDNYIAWETNYATEPKERWVMYNRVNGLNGTNQKKIISENPDFSDLKEEDCKRIGWVDVEKLAHKYFALERAERNDDFHKNATEEQKRGLYAQYDKTFTPIYAAGFKTAQSLNDKRFSLEDMYEFAKFVDRTKPSYKKQQEFIQSLQQTVWDVEVEMDCVYQGKCVKERCLTHSCDEKQLKITNNSIRVVKIL